MSVNDFEEVEQASPLSVEEEGKATQELEKENIKTEEVVVVEEPTTQVDFPVIELDPELAVEKIDITLPAGKQKESFERRAMYPEDLADSRNMEEAIYAETINLGFQSRMNHDMLHSRVEGEEGKDWTHVPKVDGSALTPYRPKIKDNDVKATGDKAILRVRSLLGKGGQITVPLWHSGFWATFNAPDEDAILAFENRITSERISLGRKIIGAAFANESVYISKAVLDFAVDHLVDTSLVNGRDGFIDNLSVLDIPHVAWGLACVMYQSGFMFTRAVITDDPNATEIQKGKVNVGKLQWTHRPSLTEKQLRHMNSRMFNRKSPESIKMYLDEFTRGVPKEVELSENVRITLKVPSAVQHIDAGDAWVSGIVDLIDTSFNVDGGVAERNRAINRLSKATQMRQFDHWVSKVSIFNSVRGEYEDFERDDEGTVEGILSDLSSDDEIRAKFFKEIIDYINDSTVSLIAVTAASPEEEKAAYPRFEKLFPIDPIAVFILLLIRRAQLVGLRSTL